MGDERQEARTVPPGWWIECMVTQQLQDAGREGWEEAGKEGNSQALKASGWTHAYGDSSIPLHVLKR